MITQAGLLHPGIDSKGWNQCFFPCCSTPIPCPLPSLCRVCYTGTDVAQLRAVGVLWGWRAPMLAGSFPLHSKFPTVTALNDPMWWAVSLKGECLSSTCYLRVFTGTMASGRGLHGCLFTSYAWDAKKTLLCGESYSHILICSGRASHGSQHVLGDSISSVQMLHCVWPFATP